LTEEELEGARVIDADEIVKGMEETCREAFRSLISASAIVLLKRKLDIDITQGINHNKVNIAKSIAKELAKILPTLYETALFAGQKYLNERIKNVTA